MSIDPNSSSIGFHITADPRNAGALPSPTEVSDYAWRLAARFGVPASELFEKPESRRAGAARETFLTWKLNGFEFRDFGLSVALGNHEEVRGFSLSWPNLEVCETQSLASAEQIIECIRAQICQLALTPDGTFDFPTLKSLEGAYRFTITGLKAVYCEGRYGVMEEGQLTTRYVAPFAELSAKAELQGRNVTVQLFSPILSSDVARLLAGVRKADSVVRERHR